MRFLGGGKLICLLASGDKRLYRKTVYPDNNTEITTLKWIKLIENKKEKA